MLLTTEEIKEALIAQGGENVVIVQMREQIESMTHLVIASGRSTRHLRKMSDSIVQAVSRTSMHISCSGCFRNYTKPCLGRQQPSL